MFWHICPCQLTRTPEAPSQSIAQSFFEVASRSLSESSQETSFHSIHALSSAKVECKWLRLYTSLPPTGLPLESAVISQCTSAESPERLGTTDGDDPEVY